MCGRAEPLPLRRADDREERPRRAARPARRSASRVRRRRVGLVEEFETPNGITGRRLVTCAHRMQGEVGVGRQPASVQVDRLANVLQPIATQRTDPSRRACRPRPSRVSRNEIRSVRLLHACRSVHVHADVARSLDDRLSGVERHARGAGALRPRRGDRPLRLDGTGERRCARAPKRSRPGIDLDPFHPAKAAKLRAARRADPRTLLNRSRAGGPSCREQERMSCGIADAVSPAGDQDAHVSSWGATSSHPAPSPDSVRQGGGRSLRTPSLASG